LVAIRHQGRVGANRGAGADASAWFQPKLFTHCGGTDQGAAGAVNDAAGIARCVNMFDFGEITSRIYDELPAQYGYSNNKLRSLAHGEEFSYCTFDSDTLNIVTFRNKAIWENDMLKILSKQDSGDRTETHLNQAAEVIYMSSGGLKFVKCDIDTAIACC